MKTFIFLALLLILSSCKNNTEQPIENSETISTSESPEKSEFKCYQYFKNMDSIYLKISINNTTIKGSLNYNLNGKDRNEGTIKGTIKGDSLFADYRFQSEGKISTREVFFFKTDSGMIEGYGPVEDSLGEIQFKDRSTLILNQNILLKPVACD